MRGEPGRLGALERGARIRPVRAKNVEVTVKRGGQAVRPSVLGSSIRTTEMFYKKLIRLGEILDKNSSGDGNEPVAVSGVLTS